MQSLEGLRQPLSVRAARASMFRFGYARTASGTGCVPSAIRSAPRGARQMRRQEAPGLVEALPRGVRAEAGMGAHGEAMGHAVVELELRGRAERPPPGLHPA